MTNLFRGLLPLRFAGYAWTPRPDDDHYGDGRDRRRSIALQYRERRKFSKAALLFRQAANVRPEHRAFTVEVKIPTLVMIFALLNSTNYLFPVKFYGCASTDDRLPVSHRDGAGVRCSRRPASLPAG